MKRGRTFLTGNRWSWLLVTVLGMLFLPQKVLAEPSVFLPYVVHQPLRPTVLSGPTEVGIPYVTKEGETLFDIARTFHRPLDQIVCALPAHVDSRAPLEPGSRLLIPPERSVCHVMSEGQTLAAVARAYGVTIGDIIALPQNELRTPPYFAPPGTRVLIPLPPGVEATPWIFGDGHFIWPVRGIISQPWSLQHQALDIAATQGDLVVAADTGRVRWAGWDTTGYGWLVIVDHGNGYRTYYAHLQTIWVSTGERVVKGEPIGAVGSTGHSTGPHLHFEIRDYGVRVNPISLLPPEPGPSEGPLDDAARAGQ